MGEGKPLKGRHADRLLSGRKPNRTHPLHRTCAEEGCSTQLSRFNGSTRCGIHFRPDEKHQPHWGKRAFEERNQRIREQYLAGSAPSEIAEQYGLSASWVAVILRKSA